MIVKYDLTESMYLYIKAFFYTMNNDDEVTSTFFFSVYKKFVL